MTDEPRQQALDALAMALHESAIGCEQHKPYRVGHDLGPVSVHRIQAERLVARLSQPTQEPGAER